MARRLYVGSRKGGDGKTTVARTVAERFCRDMKVLLVDFDDSASLSRRYLLMERGANHEYVPPVHPDYDETLPLEARQPKRPSSADIFFADRVVCSYTIYEFAGGRGLEILPANGAELQLIRDNVDPVVERRCQDVVREWFLGDEVNSEFDLIVFDAGPALTSLMRGCLRAATHVLIPVTPEGQPVELLEQMLGSWSQANASRPEDDQAELIGILPNNYRKAIPLHRQYLKQLRTNPVLRPYVAPFEVPSLQGFMERDVYGLAPESVFKLKPSDRTRRAAEELGDWVSRKLFGRVV